MQGPGLDPGCRGRSDAWLFPGGFLFLSRTNVKPIVHLRGCLITGLVRNAPGHLGVGTIFWPDKRADRWKPSPGNERSSAHSAPSAILPPAAKLSRGGVRRP